MMKYVLLFMLVCANSGDGVAFINNGSSDSEAMPRPNVFVSRHTLVGSYIHLRLCDRLKRLISSQK